MTSDRAFEAARQICRRHARSFYFASHFLPETKRAHAYAVYAFCRLLDDAVDEASVDPATGTAAIEEQLARFAVLLDRAYANDLPAADGEFSQAMRAFAITVDRCGIPKGHFLELADGVRMDLSIRRYADWKALERYCYHVAGVVGLIMCYVFELPDPSARQQAVAMGNAMQLTNILRDVREDAERGRIYLPQDEMARFGVSDDDILRQRCTRPFRALMGFQIARARALYEEGARGLASLPADGSRQTAAIMATVYGGILHAIERLDCNVFLARAHLNTLRKLARLPAALRLSAREPGDPVPSFF